MLKIGVLGAGHLGKIHLKILKCSAKYELVGFYDADSHTAKTVSEEMDISTFYSVDELIEKCDVLDIVTPTVSHYEMAKKAIEGGKHFFIEKPLSNTLKEGEQIIKLASEANLKGQVGHVERFNPAFTAAKPYCKQPMFIETHRLAEFNPRGTDVSVVLDLMIHDLDIVLSVVKSKVKAVHASGVAVISDTPDICNARIEFESGCVANLTASRISMKNMRKTRMFQKDAYISIDFLEKKSEIIRLKDVEGTPDPLAAVIDPGKGKNKKQIFFDSPEVTPNNAIQDELESFFNAIKNNTTPLVSLEDGFIAMQLAHQILENISIAKSELIK